MIHVLSPGRADQRTGGFLYNARLVADLRGRGRAVTVHELPGNWPWASESDVRRAVECIDGLGGVLLADGLLWTAVAPRVHRDVVVVLHSPLWREWGAEARRREEAALARASHVVFTSHDSVRDLDLSVPWSIVEPGTDVAPPARRPGRGALICVAHVVPRKGHDVLIEALHQVEVPVTLRCAGSLQRDPGFAARQVAAAAGLDVQWLGVLDPSTLQRELGRSDGLVSAARYEAWGMAIAEAWACGLPVVSPPAGIFHERSGGRLQVPPDDPDALAAAITRLLVEPGLADSLASEALATQLPPWTEQVAAWDARLGAMS